MNSFEQIFEETTTRLETKGVTPVISKGTPADPSALKRFKRTTDIPLPPTFASFFTEFSDGYQFTWDSKDGRWGGIDLSNLESLARGQQAWLRMVNRFVKNPKSLDRCVAPPYRNQAFAIWRRMQKWIPFHLETNGDTICVDVDGGQIRYHQHDWFDGYGPREERHGAVAADHLEDFLCQWSTYEFQAPKTLWWADLVSDGVFQWSPDHFPSW